VRFPDRWLLSKGPAHLPEPGHQEAEKRGYWTGNIPKKIRGWRQEADRLTVPRGFARQLVAILRGAGPGAQKVYGG